MEGKANKQNKKAVATGKWRKLNWSHYHNSGESTVALSRAHYHKPHSCHPTATTGTTLWLIKAIEHLKCARFTEEQRVIWRQEDSEDGLKTFWRKTSQHALQQHIFWSSFVAWDEVWISECWPNYSTNRVYCNMNTQIAQQISWSCILQCHPFSYVLSPIKLCITWGLRSSFIFLNNIIFQWGKLKNH